jgi:hypothetical protein
MSGKEASSELDKRRFPRHEGGTKAFAVAITKTKPKKFLAKELPMRMEFLFWIRPWKFVLRSAFDYLPCKAFASCS